MTQEQPNQQAQDAPEPIIEETLEEAREKLSDAEKKNYDALSAEIDRWCEIQERAEAGETTDDDRRFVTDLVIDYLVHVAFYWAKDTGGTSPIGRTSGAIFSTLTGFDGEALAMPAAKLSVAGVELTDSLHGRFSAAYKARLAKMEFIPIEKQKPPIGAVCEVVGSSGRVYSCSYILSQTVAGAYEFSFMYLTGAELDAKEPVVAWRFAAEHAVREAMKAEEELEEGEK